MFGVTRPEPQTPKDWHASLIPHLDHELIVHVRGEMRQIVTVQCASDDGRASLWTRPEESPRSEARWRPQVSARLFFGTRSVGCRTCQIPIAR